MLAAISSEPMNEPERTTASSSFPATDWTQVIGVIQDGDGGPSWEALVEFCERYRPAVRDFFRRRGCECEAAEDYTQSFFASRILEPLSRREGFLLAAKRDEHTRFRSFLCHVLWRFLQDEWKKHAAQKSGGKICHVPLEGLELAGDLESEGSFKHFGREFDRSFAREILLKAADRSRHSKHLLAHLRGEISQEEAARELGLTANAFKQAYHRFRQRLAADLWDEVSKLAGPDEKEIRAEMEYLMSLFLDREA